MTAQEQIKLELEALAFNLRALKRELYFNSDTKCIEQIQDNISFTFKQLDNLKVSYSIQNECIYQAQNTDKDILQIVKDVLHR